MSPHTPDYVDTLIGDRELEVLHTLWREGPSTVAEVRERLDDDLAYTTVLSTLRNLEAKQLVTHSTEGRVHRFAASVPAKAVHESAIARLLRTVFQGNALSLVTSLVDHKVLSAAELRALAETVEARASKGEPTVAVSSQKRGAGKRRTGK